MLHDFCFNSLCHVSPSTTFTTSLSYSPVTTCNVSTHHTTPAAVLQPILVEEPSPLECLQLLQGLAPRYETFHGVQLPHNTLATAVAAAQR